MNVDVGLIAELQQKTVRSPVAASRRPVQYSLQACSQP
jgi:hypothetical protein